MSDLHHHAEHLAEDEESYFVSMTDMMVGMLFVFIIMLMSFALNYQEAEKQKEETVQELIGADQSRTMMLEKLQNMLENAGIRVTIDRENGILRLPEDILFPSGSDSIKSAGRTALATLATGLGTVLPCYAFSDGNLETVAGGENCQTVHRLEAVFIEGHTDNIPLRATYRYQNNWELSTARAITTFKTLTEATPALGVLLNKRGEPILSVSGYGENRPVADNQSEEGRSRNRRIDLRFLMATPKPQEMDKIEERVQHHAP